MTGTAAPVAEGDTPEAQLREVATDLVFLLADLSDLGEMVEQLSQSLGTCRSDVYGLLAKVRAAGAG